MAPFKRQVLDCALLNNFFWGVWALSLLSEEEYLKSGIFNYDFAHSRCDMYSTFLKVIDIENANAIRNEGLLCMEGAYI